MRRRFFGSKTSLSYMTIEAVEYTTVGLPADIEYSFNDSNTWEEGRFGEILHLQKGAMVSFRNMRDKDSNHSFSIKGSCNLVGNCMSLIPDGKMYDSAFSSLFENCNGIISVSDDFLPATTLASGCYSSMFYGCSNLTTAPKLPATTLASGCYSSMFYGCSNLTTAPKLPATTLASGCYSSMFYGTNVLPDCSNIDFTSNTTTSSGGLIGLFAGTKITDNNLYNILPINPTTGKYWLPATTLVESCYYNMFAGCTSLTTAPELPATVLARQCYRNMFAGCTSLTTAPELPATTLVYYCYATMFNRCSKLNYIKMLATNISATSCLLNWVAGVSSTGTFVKNKNAAWNVTGASGVPSGWTIQKV